MPVSIALSGARGGAHSTQRKCLTVDEKVFCEVQKAAEPAQKFNDMQEPFMWILGLLMIGAVLVICGLAFSDHSKGKK